MVTIGNLACPTAASAATAAEASAPFADCGSAVAGERFAAPPQSKGEAILGGQESALDRIRLAQQGETLLIVPAWAVNEAERRTPLAPSAGGFRPGEDFCPATGTWSSTLTKSRTDLSSEDFLASKRLTIGRTIFDRDWTRVNRERISSTRYRQLLGEAAGEGVLAAVNKWVNNRIVYTEDRDLFSRADYWAGARRTLKLGRGDCEDIALTKMQLLAAAGIPREDMILTIARDLVRNADHAVLMVRHEGGYVMLDNSTDQILDASTSHDYQPVLSFGADRTWLHGY